MDIPTLKASSRGDSGKGVARKARAAGLVPATVYGGEGEPLNITVGQLDFLHLMNATQSEHAVIRLDVEGDKALSTPALIKEVQHHPVRGNVMHIDLMRIRLDQRISTVVPIEVLGRAPGVIAGGILDLMVREVEVECPATNVPDSVTLDVSKLEVGDRLYIRELVVPEGVAVIEDPERTVATVHAPRVVKEGAEEGVEGEAGAGEASAGEAGAGEDDSKDED